MKTLALLCNVTLLGFVALVLATDGPPREAIYVVFNVLLVMVPLLTVFVLARGGSPAFRRWAAVGNLVLFATTCFAVADQYPGHPAEEGLIAFVVVTMATPLISAVTLFLVAGRRGTGVQRATAQ
jgi:hypothetical protein